MNLPYLKTVTNKLIDISSNTSITSVTFKTIVTAFMALAGIKVYLVSVFALVILDVITGVAASIKKGESFKSKILKKGLIDKTFLYIIMLIAVFILEGLAKSVFTYTPCCFVFFAAFMISCYELISIFENIFVLNPNLAFIQPLINLTSKLSSKAAETAESQIGKEDVKNLTKNNEKK
jgi:hypothetical protein